MRRDINRKGIKRLKREERRAKVRRLGKARKVALLEAMLSHRWTMENVFGGRK